MQAHLLVRRKVLCNLVFVLVEDVVRPLHSLRRSHWHPKDLALITPLTENEGG